MQKEEMFEFRISKYDVQHRADGVYVRDEWTSMGDIGKSFRGELFTQTEYEHTEKRYLDLIEKICMHLRIDSLQIHNLEDAFGLCIYSNGHVLEGINKIRKVAKDCLRERYWCKLCTRNLFFHFGYDYYLYIGSQLDFVTVKEIADEFGLFVEPMASPYH